MTSHRSPLLIGGESLSVRAGGLNRYLAELAKALARAGAASHVLVVGPGSGGPMEHSASAVDAPLPVRLLAMRREAARLRNSVDIVDAHFALYAVLPLFTTALRRFPSIVHFQGPWADESRVGRGEGSIVTGAKRAVERLVYRKADAVVVLSAAFGHLAVERYGVHPSRIVVIPPGVDLERFRPGGREVVRARFGLDPTAFVALSVRRLDARMGLDVLLDAWAVVQAERPGALLLIAGDGRERDALEQQRDRLPHPKQVRFLGTVDDGDLVALYQATDCSVVPTRALEGFGLVTLESAACGTPVIVTEVGGLPDGVVGLDPTLIVPAGDATALAARLIAAAAGDLPTRGATRVHAERFSWDEVARRHLELYNGARSRPLRVAYIGHTAQLSGGELALARLLPALAEVEPLVILGEDGPLVERLRRDGVRVEVLPMDESARDLRRDRVRPGRVPIRAAAGSAWAILRLARRLRAERPDLVHTNTLKAAIYGGIAGRLAGVPVVWHLRDRIAPDYLPSFAVRLVRLAGRVLPTAVIGNSEVTLATLDPTAVHARIYDAVVPSPVPSAIAMPARATGSPFTVGLVGRLAPWKGQDLFLRAFAQAFANEDARARVVGSAMFGEEAWERRLHELAMELGITDRVDFVGFTHDVATEYAQLDVFVHASVIPEPFGQVVFEAMASGVAVIAADAGGPGEILTDGTDGLLYAMGDLDALGRQMRFLANDPHLRARLGQAGRRRVRDFTPDKVAAQVLALYMKVLSRPATFSP